MVDEAEHNEQPPAGGAAEMAAGSSSDYPLAQPYRFHAKPADRSPAPDGSITNVRIVGGGGKMLPTSFSPYRLSYVIGRTKSEIHSDAPVNVVIMVCGKSKKILEDEKFWPRINDMSVKPKVPYRVGASFIIQGFDDKHPIYDFRFERVCTRCNCTEGTAEFCSSYGGSHTKAADFTEKDNACCSGCIEGATENRKQRKRRSYANMDVQDSVNSGGGGFENAPDNDGELRSDASSVSSTSSASRPLAMSQRINKSSTKRKAERLESREEDAIVSTQLPYANSYRKEIWLTTTQRSEFMDITVQLHDCLNQSGIKHGFCLASAMHGTGSVLVTADAPEVFNEFKQFMEGIRARHEGQSYDASAKKARATDGQYIKRQFFGRSCSIAVSDGAFDLGHGERVFYADFGGPQCERISVKILGTP